MLGSLQVLRGADPSSRPLRPWEEGPADLCWLIHDVRV